MIVADFENLEMHLLRLIAELLCTALSGTFGPFVYHTLLHLTLWVAPTTCKIEDHGHRSAEGKLRK